MKRKEMPYYPPARSIEERENQMISLAMDNAERALRDGTASPSIICHYLKLASTREQREQERLAEEVKLLKAKTSMIEDSKRDEESFNRVIAAMTLYKGESSDNPV